VYRNSFIHFEGKDELTIPQHYNIITQVESCSLINPETLLLQHWFSFDTDFKALGSEPTSHRLIWLADMKSEHAHIRTTLN
jgi:hypothetical protein